MEEDDGKNVLNLCESWLTSLLVVGASIFFLQRFYKLSSKNYGLYMILILNLIDLTYSISNLIVLNFITNKSIKSMFASIGPPIYRFSLYWSTVISYFVFLVVKKRSIFNPKGFLLKMLILCLFLAILFFLMIYLGMFGMDIDFRNGITRLEYPTTGFFNRIMYAIIVEFLCTISPIFITLYFYYQVYKVLKENETQSGVNVMWYVVIQAICFGTGALVDLASMVLQLDKPPFILQFIASTFRRSWGFLNLVVYWFLRYTEDEEDPAEAFLDETKLLFHENRSSLSSRISEVEI